MITNCNSNFYGITESTRKYIKLLLLPLYSISYSAAYFSHSEIKTINLERLFIYIIMSISPQFPIQTQLLRNLYNSLSSPHIMYPLISMPTCENKQSNTIINNIYHNIPYFSNTYDTGILRPYNSEHQAIFSIMNVVLITNNINVVTNPIVYYTMHSPWI